MELLFFAAQGLQAFAAQGFFAAHGLQAPQAFLAAQGLQAPQAFFAAHGLQAFFGFFAAQGLHAAAAGFNVIMETGTATVVTAIIPPTPISAGIMVVDNSFPLSASM
ncbi:MAG: hypothetical protein V7723_18655 [Sneathiella sp.]|uniref:hypothetical protein n=1 Tax=Sneathiella sp. TaxID=1964365 RepID=UPI003000FF41